LTVMSLTAAAIAALVGSTNFPSAFSSAAAGIRNRVASAWSMSYHMSRSPVTSGGSAS
jgi:hypothetical protein